MELPVFVKRADCKACDLCTYAKSVGIPGRPYGTPKGLSKAVYILGDRPGVEEDAQGSHFVGITGRLLSKVYVETPKITDYADVYLANAVRCMPEKDLTVTVGQYNACRSYVQEDLRAIQAAGYTEIVVLGAGAGAAKSILKASLEKALMQQGALIQYGDVGSFRTFWTNNPMVLVADKNPSLILNVAEHLELLLSYLKHGELPVDTEIPEPRKGLRHWDLAWTPKYLSLDIETYGCVEGLPTQSVFRAKRALETDRCPVKSLVQTIALAWRSPSGAMLQCAYNLQDPQDLNDFMLFFESFLGRSPDTYILGMNTQFDIDFLLTWLGATGPRLAKALRRRPLADLGILNYLHNELRQERSLKNISPLLFTGNYDDEEISLRRGERYPDASDARLLKYNLADAIRTLVNSEKLEAMIERDYPGSQKLSEYTRQWYSNLIWFSIEAGQSGVSFDVPRLRDLEAKRLIRIAFIEGLFRRRYNGAVSGKGSKTFKEKLALTAQAEANLLGDRRVAKTPKLKTVSANDENWNLFLGNLDRFSETARQIRLLQRFTTYRDDVSRYIRPILVGRKDKRTGLWSKASTVLMDGRVYPTWYVVPSQFEDASSGGTKQGRIICRQPGLQNLSKPVKKCLGTRYDRLIEYDLSQIELRTGALVSGEPRMLEDYATKTDRHLSTALIILKELRAYMDKSGRQELGSVRLSWLNEVLSGTPSKHTPGIDPWRFLGKTINFLVLFKGGAKKAQETAIKDRGISLPLDVWQSIITEFYRSHAVFAQWQNEWIRGVLRTGRAVLPLTGHSRLFLGGKKAGESAINEIANFPIQTIAGNTMIDAVMAVRRDFRAAHLKAVANLIIYDAVYVECPDAEVNVVDKIMAKRLTDIDYWNRLQTIYGVKCPVEYEKKTLI